MVLGCGTRCGGPCWAKDLGVQANLPRAFHFSTPPRNPESTTSRELVAEMIVEVVNREDLLQPNRFEFDDGDDVPKI